MGRWVAYALVCVVMTLCMAAGAANARAALADEGAGDSSSGDSATQSAVVKDVDADTTNGYTASLGSGDSTRYSGRVWTDKTVYTDQATFSSDDGKSYTVENDSDFLVAYSALATSSTVTSTTPTDTVFILDFSTSMTWGYDRSGVSVAQQDSRIQAMITALNSTIDTLVKANPENRIAIAVFNGSSGVLLGDLTSGTAILEKVSDGNYLEITDYNYTPGADGGRAEVTCNINGANATTGGGTNIQAGLFAGMGILANNGDTTFTVEGQQVTRVPNVVLMSDGAPTTFSSATDATYTDGSGDRQTGEITNSTDIDRDAAVQSGSWWDTSSGKAIGSGNNDDPDSADGFMALLTAAYYKNAITSNYYPAGDGSTNVYTIGFGTSVQDADMVAMANLVLNPA